MNIIPTIKRPETRRVLTINATPGKTPAHNARILAGIYDADATR